MKLQVLPLNQASFAAYGDVIETADNDFFHINNGKVERYHDLTKIEILQQDRTLLSINRAKPAELPIIVSELEKHPLGSQAFIPMNGEQFIVIVANGDEAPELDTLRAFITNGRQGINYHRNVWHHPLFAWQTETDFLTVDRGGADNCVVVALPQSYQCVVPEA
ncbi:ureidoglycolate lyase [Budvicia diplopodorum]|uniref:ureidoglycolate lyase n=1 Tax=Budvicia diplopodorum TaxID=1119056 RepID=UPI001357BA2A|nr:ureidoglycolate lyase [Budvicia diplopodorum]